MVMVGWASRAVSASTSITLGRGGHSFTFRPDGWFNMTSAAQHFDKRLDNFWASPETKEYIQALASSLKLSDLELFQAIPGNRYITNRGTWAHPKLAVFSARWLDVRFSVWCDSVIDELLRGKAIAVPTPAPRAAQVPAPVDDHRLACLEEFKAQTHLLQGLYAVVRTQAAPYDEAIPSRSGEGAWSLKGLCT